ncbi:putative F-box/LRR-repeat protein 23 isoform X1 [Triticum dicoccoides]|uniref:putative F-box/LRR-repeat protein 23 isoform X1 n=1 Tax=Triticum dicoccoides TaxID=85692 RepID=UPI001890C220|nr:putative F-box/LRR-repeat protein 23 isoform X1 [Triticum dicoccoides]
MCARGPSARDWSEMPLDALTCVFAKLGAVELLMGAGLVCRSWLHASKAPELWRAVVMSRPPDTPEGTEAFLRAIAKVSSELRPSVLITGIDDPWSAMVKVDDSLCAMAKAAVDRSGGRLQKFVARDFGTDELLEYIADRSPSLKSLGLMQCHDISEKGFMDLIVKFPQLEELVLIECHNISDDQKENRDVYEAISRARSQLKLFVLAHPGYFLHPNGSYGFHDGDVLGIATMKQLRHLSLDCVNINNAELVSIIDSCPYLEHLCMRNCYNIVADEALRAKCARIKTLKLKPMSVETASNDCCFVFFDPPVDEFVILSFFDT